MKNTLPNAEKNITIFVPGNIPSLKNGKIKGIYLPKTVTKWLRIFGIKGYSSSSKQVYYFKKIPPQYNIEEILSPLRKCKSYPLLVGMHFIRGSKHLWDFNNATHILFDLMTALNIIPDDNILYVLPFPLKIEESYWSYDKENPGVIIKILNNGSNN